VRVCVRACVGGCVGVCVWVGVILCIQIDRYIYVSMHIRHPCIHVHTCTCVILCIHPQFPSPHPENFTTCIVIQVQAQHFYSSRQLFSRETNNQHDNLFARSVINCLHSVTTVQACNVVDRFPLYTLFYFTHTVNLLFRST